jgi:hypothetical protein
MRTFWRCLAAAAFGLLVLAAAPALADDQVLVTADQPIRIGSLLLGPGDYALRSDSSRGTRNVLSVTSPDGKTFYGLVLANFDVAPEAKLPSDRLVFDEADGKTLRSWVVAWRGATYLFQPGPVPPALAAKVRRSPDAATAAR